MERKIYKTISGKKPDVVQYLREVWMAKGLIVAFASRDLKVQYAQTYLGLLWSVVQPLTGLAIFSFFFQRLVPLAMNVPYAVFAFTGIMGWFYFTLLVGQGGTSLMNNRQIIQKIHFPRLILPLSKAFVGLIEFSISLIILLLVMFFTGCEFSMKMLLLPLAVLANIISGLSIGIWLGALTIRFRDLHHVIPFLIGFGIWLTPVFYPTTLVPSAFNWIYYFHPVANVIALYRWMFIGMPIDFLQVAVSLTVAILIFVFGLVFFVRNEKHISDYL